jgi:ElaB/YqjD/DUF883 family membrane-anchored ribosome-binding protein
VDHELEVIRDQMEGTRASLADKLEALESQVLGTVHSATETVSSAVEGAKDVVSSVTEGAKDVVDTVTETVESVKESLSINRYVEQYPWASLGVAVAAGFAAGQLLPRIGGTSGDRSQALSPASSGGYGSGGYSQAAAPARSYQPAASESHRDEGSSWTSALSGVWSTAATTVEGLAVGTLMGAIKDLVSRSLPQQWQGELTRMVDDVTTRLGGKVVQGNPLQELLAGLSTHQDGNQQHRSNEQDARG